MSVSATTAAKRRRAGNIVSSQLFKPTSAPIENSIQRRTAAAAPAPAQNIQSTSNVQTQQPVNIQQTNAQRPMSLQQVISVFDKRLLHIESVISNDQQTFTNPSVTTQPSITTEQVQELIQQHMNEYISEFDHRYQMLASEIANLKQIVLKLQSYTLDVNKSLIEERIQILSDMKANVVIQPEDTLNLKEDLEVLSETIQESDPDETEENITFDLNNNDIKEELIQDSLIDDTQNTNDKDLSSEVPEQEVATEIIDNLDEGEEIIQETSDQDVIVETIEEEEEDIVEETLHPLNEENIIEEVIPQFTDKDAIEESVAEETLEKIMDNVVKDEIEDKQLDTKEQLSEDLTELSKELNNKTNEEPPAKQKRKRKNKKNISVNV